MRVVGLDGRSYPWKLRLREVGVVDEIPRSSLHLAVRAFLREQFPTEPLLEEVFLPGSGGLEADFYLPVRRTLVEAHGKQHRAYTPFFHGSRSEWIKHQQRDLNKIRWAEINSLRLVALHHNESPEEWLAKF